MQLETKVWRPGGDGKKERHRLSPSTPGMTVCPSETERAYAAGILDGEGCIMARPNHGNYFITVHNTNQEVLDYLQSVFRIGVVKERTDKGPLSKLPAYIWQIYGAYPCYDFLKALMPYLIIKRETAKNAMKSVCSKYYCWEISCAGASLPEILTQLQAADAALKATWGGRAI